MNQVMTEGTPDPPRAFIAEVYKPVNSCRRRETLEEISKSKPHPLTRHALYQLRLAQAQEHGQSTTNLTQYIPSQNGSQGQPQDAAHEPWEEQDPMFWTVSEARDASSLDSSESEREAQIPGRLETAAMESDKAELEALGPFNESERQSNSEGSTISTTPCSPHSRRFWSLDSDRKSHMHRRCKSLPTDFRAQINEPGCGITYEDYLHATKPIERPDHSFRGHYQGQTTTSKVSSCTRLASSEQSYDSAHFTQRRDSYAYKEENEIEIDIYEGTDGCEPDVKWRADRNYRNTYVAQRGRHERVSGKQRHADHHSERQDTWILPDGNEQQPDNHFRGLNSTHRDSKRSPLGEHCLTQKEDSQMAKPRPKNHSCDGDLAIPAFAIQKGSDRNCPTQQSEGVSSSLSKLFSPYMEIHGIVELSTYLASSSYIISLGGSPLPDLKYGIIVVPIGDEHLLFRRGDQQISMSTEFREEVLTRSREAQQVQEAKSQEMAKRDFINVSSRSLDGENRESAHRKWSARSRKQDQCLIFDDEDLAHPKEKLTEESFQERIHERKEDASFAPPAKVTLSVSNEARRVSTHSAVDGTVFIQHKSAGIRKGHDVSFELGARDHSREHVNLTAAQKVSQTRETHEREGGSKNDRLPEALTQELLPSKVSRKPSPQTHNARSRHASKATKICSPLGNEVGDRYEVNLKTEKLLQLQLGFDLQQKVVKSQPAEQVMQSAPHRMGQVIIESVEQPTTSLHQQNEIRCELAEQSAVSPPYQGTVSSEALRALEEILKYETRCSRRSKILHKLLHTAELRHVSASSLHRRQVLLQVASALTSLANGELDENPGISDRVWKAAYDSLDLG